MSYDTPERVKAEIVDYIDGRFQAGHTMGDPTLAAIRDHVGGLPAEDRRFQQIADRRFIDLGLYQFLKIEGMAAGQDSASRIDPEWWFDRYVRWLLDNGDHMPDPSEL